jgi:RNA polymerase sigma-70 factor (ECF subfamily)
MTENIFTEFYPKIYNYIYYRVLNKEIAEDITGEVFYKAIANEANFNPRRASYSTWLFTIAHNCATDYFRSQKQELSLDNISDTPGDSFTDDGLIIEEDLRRLYSLLKELPERERTVLALRFWGEFSHKEIAVKMDLTEKNVSVILSRTIAKLKLLW